MTRSPYLVREPLNTENTVRNNEHRSHHRFPLLGTDKYVLFGGGTNYKVEVVQVPPHSVELDPRIHNLSGSPVSIYVLSQCLVLWMHHDCIGIHIPYPLVALHAVKEVDHRPTLYLQLLSCELFQSVGPQSDEYIHTVELVIYQEGNGRNLMLLEDDCTIQQLYDAMSTCSGFHIDRSFEDDGEDNGGEANNQWITGNDFSSEEIPAEWLITGVADDLGDFHEIEEEEGGEAGMNVSLVSGQVAGVTRRRSSGSERLKIRRLR